jgi:alkyl sulfatase BDS1-like metallo-beta-lactamase superfamily hydrolase
MAIAGTTALSLIRVCYTTALLCLLSACGGSADTPSVATPQAGSAELEAHSAEFERAVIEVTDGVYVAVGYALANTIMIEGDDGVIIVDTTESMSAAKEVKAEFDKITDKPVKAIIYTHNHTDHIFGAKVFAQGRDVPVYAHDSTWSHIERIMSVLRPVIEVRSYHMFGTYLEGGGERVVNDGIGPALTHDADGTGEVYGLIKPTHTFSDTLEVTIAGRRLQLIHSPGETDDQIVVWLPDERVLLPGDNVYKAFPNLYTIRGTRYRDVMKWATTIGDLRELGAHYLVPSHTRPVSGAAEIDGILTAYGDAIQYVHDQTVRGMNAGMDAQDLVETISLPPHLANHPWLQPFYGTLAWSVRSVYDGYLGWFDGNSTHLFPTAKKTRAQRLVDLSGGAQAVLTAAQQSMSAGDAQWAAELADLLLESAGAGDVDHYDDAKLVKAQALRQLASATPNPNARNWYLTDALELEGRIVTGPSALNAERVEFAKSFPIEGILKAMAVSLDTSASAGVDQRVVFVFPDQNKRYQVHVRNQIAAVKELPVTPSGAVEVTVNAGDWIELVTGQKGFPLALANGTVSVTGGLSDVGELLSFLQLFQTE